MGLKFTCPNCGSEVFARLGIPGGSARCLACGTESVVPPDAAPCREPLAVATTPPRQMMTPPPAPPMPLEFGPCPKIRGLLILPAIGFVIGPIGWWITVVIISRLLGSATNAIQGAVFLVMLLGVLAVLVYTVVTAVRFFEKRKSAPSMAIKVQIANTVITVLFWVGSLASDDAEVKSELWRNVVVQATTAAIWIPYFMFSKRVKATFIR